MKTGFAFTRAERLLSSADFKAVFDGASVRVSDRHLLILAIPNKDKQLRLGLVIAKKHIKRAVDRNRVKRLIRESFRLNKATLPSVDIVVLARKGMGELDNKELQQLLNNSWLRLNKYAKRSPKTQR